MKNFIVLFTFYLLFSGNVFSVPIDTGMIEWLQPNGVKFTAQKIGDEFSFKFTTKDGYEIREGSDGWFYYATLDNKDNIVPSKSKIGIDVPPGESYRLQLPAYKISEIEKYREQFKQQLLEADEWFKQKRIEANGGTVTLKIGVILVDFADDVHYRGENFPNGYPIEFFNDMIFSNNGDWYDPEGLGKHPEHKKIFGSLRDYLNQQSSGKLDIIGKDGIYPEILNPHDPNHYEVPDWVYLDETRAHWNGQSIDNPFWNLAKDKFHYQFPNIDLSIYDRLVFIFAGEEGTSNHALWPHTRTDMGYQMSEQWQGSILTTLAFSHIGVHAHEFCHLLGVREEAFGDYNNERFDVMASGLYNGPERKGECPAGISPFYRIKWGWNNAIFLNEESYQDLQVEYNYQNPNYYRLDNPYDETEYFLIENRLREGFDKWTPNDPEYIITPPDNKDLNGTLGGLLIWTIDEDNLGNDVTGLKCAAIDPFKNNQEAVPFPYNNDPSGLNLTSETNPDNSIRNVSNPGILIENIRWEAPNILVNISHDYSENYTVLSSNQTWNNTRIIDKDLLILGNVTLTLKEGAILKFHLNKKLQVLNTGAINIQSSGNPVELTWYTPEQRWNGIELNGPYSELQGSNLKICNSYKAIKFQNSRNISFSNIRFENNLKCLNINVNQNNPSIVELENCKFVSSPIELLNSTNDGNTLTLSLKNCNVNSSSIVAYVDVKLNLINNDFRSGSNITLSTLHNNIIKNNIFLESNITLPSGGFSTITYNCIFPYPQNISLYSQAGNFSAEPYFLTGGNGSQLFEYSPCIDAGDPSDDFSNEPGNNGGRINIGSLGNTSLATQVNSLVPQVLSGSNLTFLGNFIFNYNSKWNINNTATLLANVTLLTGAQLIINPGVNLNFSSAASFTINGILNAQGIVTNKIKFNRIGTSGTWGNLIFDGAGSSNSNLNNVEVKNGAGVMFLNNANVTLQNSLIDHCTQGIYVYDSQPQILYNQIIEPVQNGIYCNALGKSPLLLHNVITKTSNNPTYRNYQGIWVENHTNGYIANNDIGGFFYGIYIGGGSCGYFSNYSLQNFYPNNRIRYNSTGIVAGWGSSISAGYGTYYGKYNSIYGNVSYDVYSYQSSSINAQYNYWGGVKPKQYKDGTSSINVSYSLSTDPWNAGLIPNTNVPQNHNLYSSDDLSSLENNQNSISELTLALDLESAGKINEAIGAYENMIKNNINTNIALTSLARIKTKFNRSDLFDYFSNLYNASTTYDNHVTKILAGMSLQNNDYEGAMSFYDEIIKDNGYGYEGINTKFEKFFAALIYKKDYESASELLAEISSLKLTEKELVVKKDLAEYLYRSIVEKDGILYNNTNQPLSTNESEVPKEYFLYQNFPNPFNPTTTIKYHLPQDSKVELKVFDILGNEVCELVNEIQAAGPKEFKFNASYLASGVYFYRIQAGDFVETKKMILMK